MALQSPIGVAPQANHELKNEMKKFREEWKKKERQLIYEREQVTNNLLEMEVYKTKLEKEVESKNIRITELMALLK